MPYLFKFTGKCKRSLGFDGNVISRWFPGYLRSEISPGLAPMLHYVRLASDFCNTLIYPRLYRCPKTAIAEFARQSLNGNLPNISTPNELLHPTNFLDH